MKKLFEGKAAGFYLYAVTILFAIAGLISYTQVMHRQTITVGILIGMLVVFLVGIIGVQALGEKAFLRSLPLVGALLFAAAIAEGARPMINQVGFVVSGLDPVSTLMGFIVFEAVCLIGMLLSIVASYLKFWK